ncbi:cytochrome P450 2C31-like [Phasianus colchicus]|uniref:cytochrome P450 2C31-like n=1 Tax=Phasianus colchicus TaxID=9054 RepID=UPI00129DAAA8|nr:cytochrome P450 2C31-like [Phasianus colchicus]
MPPSDPQCPPLTLIDPSASHGPSSTPIAPPQLSSRYGPVLSLRLGSEQAVVVSGVAALRELLVTRGDEFTSRGHFAIGEKQSADLGLFMSNGATWISMRRFALTALRDAGMGSRRAEEMAMEEAAELIRELEKGGTAVQDPSELLSAAVGNVALRLLCGCRFPYGDSGYRDALRCMAENLRIESSAAGKLYNALPALLDPLPGAHRRFFRNNARVRRFLDGVIAGGGEKSGETPRDFVSAFRRKMEEAAPGSPFTAANLQVSAFDLFLAGTETTSMALRYGMMAALREPAVMERVQEELDRVVGSERPPSLRDRPALPYTDAVIHEVQRHLDLIPLGFVRSVTRDTPFRGYIIPKGSTIYPLLSSALKDPHYFPNPERFDPQHFLDSEGKFRRCEAFMPFSAGRRMCLGEPLARTQIFIFITALLQRFRLCPPPGEEPPELRPDIGGITNIPPALRLRFCPR